jgi:hypothetical protein
VGPFHLSPVQPGKTPPGRHALLSLLLSSLQSEGLHGRRYNFQVLLGLSHLSDVDSGRKNVNLRHQY